jgi:hypothetical protein
MYNAAKEENGGRSAEVSADKDIPHGHLDQGATIRASDHYDPAGYGERFIR